MLRPRSSVIYAYNLLITPAVCTFTAFNKHSSRLVSPPRLLLEFDAGHGDLEGCYNTKQFPNMLLLTPNAPCRATCGGADGIVLLDSGISGYQVTTPANRAVSVHEDSNGNVFVSHNMCNTHPSHT